MFGLYANVRPARTYVTGGRFEDVDIVLIRENTEGLYVGVEHFIPIDDDPHAVAEASGIITRSGSRRIAKYAFEYAIDQGRRKITIVHKANILKCLSGLFLETASQVGEKYQDRIEIDTRIVDACAMQLVQDPSQFDMILTTNMFGDILSDLMAGLVGGLGLTPGANIGKDAAIFEAVHGSAPDIAGKGIANPTALLLAAALLALGGASCYALYQIATRRLSATEAPLTTLAYTALIGVLATRALMPFLWLPPAPMHWFAMIGLGLLGGIGHFALIKAFQFAPAATVTPFGYSNLIWAVLFGYLIFGDLPDGWTVSGALVIAGSGLYIAHRERTLARQARA